MLDLAHLWLVVSPDLGAVGLAQDAVMHLVDALLLIAAR